MIWVCMLKGACMLAENGYHLIESNENFKMMKWLLKVCEEIKASKDYELLIIMLEPILSRWWSAPSKISKKKVKLLD